MTADMDRYWDRLRLLAPHYLAMLVLVILVLMGFDALGIDLPRLARWLTVGAVIIGYVLVLRAIGRAPEPWA